MGEVACVGVSEGDGDAEAEGDGREFHSCRMELGSAVALIWLNGLGF